ncbi:hypothetical protein C8F04DRAFT_921005, partial [Mycena alexandri]
AWVDGCDQLKIPIKSNEATKYVTQYRARKNQKTGTAPTPQGGKRSAFSQEAFVNAIVDFVVGDDQSINVIENEQLRAIFLMLRSKLKDSDIPHRTKLRKRIIEIWDEHLDTLQDELGVEHLATAFMHIINRIKITHKIGWITLDNASNNDTFMVFLEAELTRLKIPFLRNERRI